MVSCFSLVTDEQILPPNKAVVLPNMKKATTFCLTVCRAILKAISNE
jgi:hypothetical protein